MGNPSFIYYSYYTTHAEAYQVLLDDGKATAENNKVSNLLYRIKFGLRYIVKATVLADSQMSKSYSSTTH